MFLEKNMADFNNNEKKSWKESFQFSPSRVFLEFLSFGAISSIVIASIEEKSEEEHWSFKKSIIRHAVGGILSGLLAALAWKVIDYFYSSGEKEETEQNNKSSEKEIIKKDCEYKDLYSEWAKQVSDKREKSEKLIGRFEI